MCVNFEAFHSGHKTEPDSRNYSIQTFLVDFFSTSIISSHICADKSSDEERNSLLELWDSLGNSFLFSTLSLDFWMLWPLEI